MEWFVRLWRRCSTRAGQVRQRLSQFVQQASDSEARTRLAQLLRRWDLGSRLA